MLADIVRLRQNQQQILGTDDETESDDNDLATIALTRSRLRDEIREIIPQKKLNGVRRLNDELTGSRLSNRLQAVIQQQNVNNVNNNAWITNTLRRAYDEDFLDVENAAINAASNSNDIQSNGTTSGSTTRSRRRKNLRNRAQAQELGCESQDNIEDNEQESKESNLPQKINTSSSSKRKRSQQNSEEVTKPKKPFTNLTSSDTLSSTPTKDIETVQSFISNKESPQSSKAHECGQHSELKPQSEFKTNKTLNKKPKEKFKIRKKRARKTKVASDQSSHMLSDDQPSTSAAARAALTASSLNTSINVDINNVLEDYNETRSNIYRNYNCVKGGSETNDEYQKKVERVKRVYAKNYESDSD